MHRANDSAIENLFRPVRLVERLFKKTTTVLTLAELPYAVVGGFAVSAWVASVDEGATRFTKDVDILIRRSGLPAISSRLIKSGMRPVDVLGVPTFVDRSNFSPTRTVRVLFANEKVRPEHPIASPDVNRARWDLAYYPVIDLLPLVTMKLVSFRTIDRVHLTDLKGVGLVDATMLDRVPAEFRGRLQQILDTVE